MRIHLGKHSTSGDDATLAASGTENSLRLSAATDDIELGRPQRLFSGIVAFLLFVGLGVPFTLAVGLDLADISPVACTIVAIALIVICTGISGRARIERYGYIAIAVALVAVVLIFNRQFLDGGAAVLNSLIKVIGSQTSTYDLPFTVGDAGGLVLFSCVASALLAIICSRIALQGSVVLCIILSCCVAVLHILGLADVTLATPVLIIGVAGCFISNTMSLNDVSDGRTALACAIAVLAVSVICGIGVSAGTGMQTIDTSSQRTSIESFVDQIRYGGASWAMPEGHLNGLGARASSDRPAFTVTTTSSSINDYFRGFVGSSYSNGNWSGLGDDTVVDNQGLFYWLGEDGFGTQEQLALAANASGFTDASDENMTIAYEGARGPYAYLPYSYAGGAQIATTTDMSESKVVGSADSTTFSIYEPLLRKSYLLQSALVKAQGGTEASLTTYLADESTYRDFVDKSYLEIPESVANTFNELLGAPQKLDAEQAKAQVLQVLDTTLTYDTNASTSNGGTDFVTYLLTDSLTGYDVHYATVAALMLRYYGVPSRYVEGYRVSASTGADGSNTVEVTESDAHAWVEYYLDGVGWIPFEVSPEYRDDTFYEPSDNTQESDLGDQLESGANNESSWTPEVVQDDTEEADQTNPDNSGVEASQVFWLIIGILLVLIAGIIARTIVLRRRLADMIETFSSSAPADVATRMFSYGLYLGRHALGCRFENIPYTEQGDIAQSQHLCESDVFVAAARVNERALFSNEELFEDDRAAMSDFLGQIDMNIRNDAGALKRFKLGWIDCVWLRGRM